jgi:hypothetical protein
MSGWTLSHSKGLAYTFSDRIFFSMAEITIYTRSGKDTPVAAYLGSESSIWCGGEVITLKDAQGNVVDTFTIGKD